VALFPRRLYEARGLHETLEAFDFLLPRHANLDLHLCGQASPEDAERTRHFVARHPGRVSWYELDMADMSQAYARSHIVLIPTAYAEGTSLSCIEAMATRNAVIATNVGGLPNLITDGYSGLLIRPDTWDLVRAVERLLEDRELAATLAQNALDVSHVFDKKRWAQRWEALIRSVMQLPDQRQWSGDAAQSRNLPG
jgi:glycosyltransferase involved in cell wall biosynthesis